MGDVRGSRERSRDPLRFSWKVPLQGRNRPTQIAEALPKILILWWPGKRAMAGQRKRFVFNKLKIPKMVVTLSPPPGDEESSTLVP